MTNNEEVTKSINLDISSMFIDEERTIKGIASHIGYPADSDMDIMDTSAFDSSVKSFKEGGRKIKLLDGHQYGAKETVGLVTDLWVEDGLLMFKAKISKSSSGEDIYIKLKEGILDQVSIGFMILDYDFTKEGIRIIKDIDIREISVVPIPANDKANILEVKEAKNNDADKTESEQTSTDNQQYNDEYLRLLRIKYKLLNNGVIL